MKHALASVVALGAMLLVSAGCEERRSLVTLPGMPLVRTPAPPSPVPMPYVDPGFPPAPAGSWVYGRTSPSTFPGSQRYVFHEHDDRFSLQFRLMGSVDVPRTGLVIAANLQHLSGKPWAASAQIALPQGDQRILLEPRGSRRLSSQTLLDLRVSRMIHFGSGRRIELLVDVLNALDDTAEEGLATDNLFSPNFGQGAVFMDPRRAMVGARLHLGR